MPTSGSQVEPTNRGASTWLGSPLWAGSFR